MSIHEKLDRRVSQATDQIGQMKRGHQTSGQMLGIPNEILPSVDSNTTFTRLESRNLTDNSQLIKVDTAVDAMIRELPIGSIIGITNVGSSLTNIPEQFIDSYEIIGAKLQNHPQGSIFWGLVRTDESGKQLPWRTYEINGFTVSEKSDVIRAVQTLLNPKSGIEASQILSALFATNSQQTQAIYADRNLSGAGCLSHDKPKQAIPANLLLGSATPLTKPVIINPNSRALFVRGYLTDNFQFSPLAHPSEENLDTSHVLRVALVNQAQRIASTNPTNMGAGTKSESVLEAIYQTTEQLPELVGNGASIPQAKKEFRNKLK